MYSKKQLKVRYPKYHSFTFYTSDDLPSYDPNYSFRGYNPRTLRLHSDIDEAFLFPRNSRIHFIPFLAGRILPRSHLGIFSSQHFAERAVSSYVCHPETRHVNIPHVFDFNPKLSGGLYIRPGYRTLVYSKRQITLENIIWRWRDLR
jgi:hypothetical protein